MFNIVLVEPEIPHNAGAAGRLAVATGSRLHLVKPLGFSIDDKQVRRAGLDYWKHVDLVVWDSWLEYQTAHKTGQQEGIEQRSWFLSTKGTKSLWEANFQEGDHLIFGAETRGLSEQVHQQIPKDSLLRVPMAPGAIRSLNLSTSIGIVLYEAARQIAPDWDSQT